MRTIAIIILALVLIYDFMTVGPMNAAITRAGKTFTGAVVDAGAWAQEKAHDYRVQKRLREAALEHDTAMREVLALEEKETEAGQPNDAPPVPQLKMAMADDFGDSVFSRQAIDSFIQEASALTDIPEDYLAHLAQRESSFDPVAAAGTSSAKGLYQFTESTWLDVFSRHCANHGQGALVRYITAENGRPMVVNTRIKRRLLNLRYDPKLSTFMAAQYAREQRAFLTR
ncbi:MAG: transglycosylase SLT domain-containing protein [Pseudomonadota bacterium]